MWHLCGPPLAQTFIVCFSDGTIYEHVVVACGEFAAFSLPCGVTRKLLSGVFSFPNFCHGGAALELVTICMCLWRISLYFGCFCGS